IPHSRPVQQPRRREVLQLVVDDYADKIRTVREKLGLTQEEFSKRLNERASAMQKIESGQFKPSIETARKLERLLRIQLVEQYDEKGDIPVSSGHAVKSEGFTMGDFIKDKRKK
ncbi:MAG: multiprotein-bridging factor 1 family protein, partial [Candidatus Woesearchaeota archaeon]